MIDRANATSFAAAETAAISEWQQTLDAIPQHIVVLDKHGSVEQVNQSVLDYTGLTVKDIRLPGFREKFIHPDDWARLGPERQQGLRNGARFQLELRSRGKDGEYKWFLMIYNPQRDEQGNVVRWYATGTDIDGLRIFFRPWRPAEPPRGIVGIVPGFNSHGGYYAWVGSQLASQDLAVYAVDLRGRGKSDPQHTD